MIKRLLFTSLILLSSGCSSLDNVTPYVAIGANVKINETTIDFYDGSSNTPFGAEFSIGVEVGENHEIKLHHDSNWFQGWPVNNKSEYSVDKITYTYKYRFGK